MKINHQNRLIFDMILLAKKAVRSINEEDIQRFYGSDYYIELRNYIESFFEYDWLDFMVETDKNRLIFKKED